ncbi:unnamed protein product [Paramecium primaurelia]|uniref:Uncharacterized protein n=1 Tax=Paramecium primaurelia TaxID=5886 RepID=A0A8S1K9G0_PARPR|nr:unnamed protein product [Paramecium primaurelia]
MQSNNPKQGLLSNQSDSQQKNCLFEFEDFGVDQDQIYLDDAKIQTNTANLNNLHQEPITMLKSNQNSILQTGQSEQQQQLLLSNPIQQQVLQKPMLNTHNLSHSHQHQTIVVEQLKESNSNQISHIQNENCNQSNQMQSTCMFCLTLQLIPENKYVFMCYNCKQINKLIYAYFICGTCRKTVIYQQGISNLINCTNCLTINYIQQQNLPNTFLQTTFQAGQLQSQFYQTQTISSIQNQQQIQSSQQQQQQQNHVSDLEAQFKELIN